MPQKCIELVDVERLVAGDKSKGDVQQIIYVLCVAQFIDVELYNQYYKHKCFARSLLSCQVQLIAKEVGDRTLSGKRTWLVRMWLVRS